ncbi:MAG: PAS domain S-box protein [bacterium]|nr:PAS domain S-box protein [bacterium]
MRLWPLIFLSIFIPGFLWAEPIILDYGLDTIELGKHLDYLEDKTGSLTVYDLINPKDAKKINWTRSKKKSPGFGYTRSAFWFRFTVKNDTVHTVEWYLDQFYSYIDDIRLYLPTENGKYLYLQTGDNYPFDTRPVFYRSFAFPVETQSGEQKTYYLRYKTSSPMAIDLKIMAPESFQVYREKETIILWIYITILVVMFLYNFVMSVTIKDLSYLLFSLYLAFFAMYVICYYGIGFQFFWPSAVWWENHGRLFFIGTGLFLAITFSRHFIGTWKYLGKADNILIGFSVLLVGFSLFSLFYKDVMISSIIASVLLGISGLALISMVIYLAVIKKSRQSLYIAFSSGFIFLGGFMAFLKSFGILPLNFVTANGFQIGSVFQVLLLSLGLADKINHIEKKLAKARTQYRHLVENTGDIIFSLDQNLNFLTVNRAVEKQLGYRKEEILQKNLLDLIEEAPYVSRHITRDIIDEYISDMKKTHTTISFNTSFKKRYGHEPKELSVKLEYIKSGKKTDILGKASEEADDIILQFLGPENSTYYINNFLSNIELLSQRLTHNVSKYMPPSEIAPLKLATREILINAIEHGNLNIQSWEKTEALKNNNYFQFIKERQHDPRYKDKKVTVEYSLTGEMVSYRVSDEGEGFDHKRITQPGEDTSPEDLYHGRGLLLVREVFDVIEFNEKGNEVLLVKYLKEK